MQLIMLRLINGLPALEKQMNDQGVPDFEMFKQWLVEEKAYLEGLSQEPLQEMLQMEYYQSLVNLDASQFVILSWRNSLSGSYFSAIHMDIVYWRYSTLIGCMVAITLTPAVICHY
ncbi:hypothetical protein C0992_005599 [Termitomyces sp. T32_za158]|nr:hypothetical protein C0992_005599 [Termitomyces sp. T32_za158]